MNLLQRIKRPFIWLSRFRHRCGYGVHSPFAFNLITDVIYEKRAYYAYIDLKNRVRQAEGEGVPVKTGSKVNKLLFRLVNRMQPQTVIELGHRTVAAPYMQAAKPSATYKFLAEPSSFPDTVDFLYLNGYEEPSALSAAFREYVSRTTPNSLFVVLGIHHSKAMKQVWEAMKVHSQVGITFDLYDVGLLFFDRSKIKQHYIVNF